MTRNQCLATLKVIGFKPHAYITRAYAAKKTDYIVIIGTKRLSIDYIPTPNSETSFNELRAKIKEPIRTNFKQGINALIRLMINEEKQKDTKL